MDLKEFTDLELFELYANCIKELRSRDVIRTNSITGEFGEHIVIDYFNKNPSLPKLSLVDPGVEGYDAYARNGDRYSIKTCTGQTTGIFPCLNEKGIQVIKKQSFDYVVICKLDHDFSLEAIYQLDWETFLRHKKWAKSLGTWNLTLTKKMISECKILYKRD